MKKILESLFIVFLVLFILSGALLVIGQLFGLITQSGKTILFSHNTLADVAFILSAITSVIAYIWNMVYNKKPKNNEETEPLNETS
ncbi:hypothetical protein [Bacillus sp. Cr_A10]|uniref:hypothetical protein n=1 Tax=Bacillaceae TaxID=186817 RepID=UPI0023DC13B7|nr:hypothetical protein [Bacillus sp. Cr_A10]MDF2066914.1 hypothetical protein [Bacillus sp. Cr_A10]